MDTETVSNMEVEESEPRHSEVSELNSSENVTAESADTREQGNDNTDSTTVPPANAVDSSSSDNNTRRDKCAYGQNCYRKNVQHKVKFSHPGDADYDEVDTRPECPYGIQCYRKNPQHKRDYQHTKRRPRRQAAGPDVHFADYFSSDEESVDESDYDPAELGLDYDDDDDEMSDENFIDDDEAE